MNATDCMSCRARGCGTGDVAEHNTATGTVVECRTCGFRSNREERDAIASYYERAIESERMARDVAWVRAAPAANGGAHVVARALGVTSSAAGMLVRHATGTPDDIAAAIRAARGAL